ncbi:MAG: hypothetical protein A3H27_09945 [Acidobacteria bacterium RIFCSPLOWO2_02_FULL_59_13]|nr:MAG: hypothetical protein A3H27_09945 [Acidobacteria bacterium RIFCSPLOWO2_02_FULL_59_13]OGA71880.1 MAG: hypothetical protein A3G81_12100 [Betaproteobacteria bacterium RIFCSPLOWO2_12_FULL_65_14]
MFRLSFFTTLVALAVAAPSGTFAQGAQSGPIRIGVLSDMNGIFSSIAGPGSVHAARLAAEDFGGQVLGRKIEIIQGDHQNKADIGAAIAREWIDVGGVTAITEVIGSAVGLAVQSVIRQKDKIALFSGSGADDLIGKQCAPGGFVWSFNTYTQAKVTGTALMGRGYDSWYLVSQDSAFGASIERNLAQVARVRNAKIVGTARFPVVNQDFSSFLLNAQASRAKVIALTGGDVSAFVKQAHEFGVVAGGQNLSAMMVWIQWVHALTAQRAQGLFLSSSFYWDMNDRTRAWTKRFLARAGFMPSMTHAGSYSAVKHYLKAVAAAGTTDNKKVIAEMRRVPVDDDTASGRVREDGLLLRDFYLFEVKKPSESKSEWDLYKLVSTVKADEAAPSLAASECPNVKR